MAPDILIISLMEDLARKLLSLLLQERWSNLCMEVC